MSAETSTHHQILEEAREKVRSLPVAGLQSAGVFIDRIDENPEAPRHFLAYGDWGPVEPEEVFANLDPETKKTTLVYLDLPYCKTFCNFCAFYPVIARKPNEIDNYISAVKKEIALLERCYFHDGTPVETVELGGGTPTMTPLPLLQDVVREIFSRFPVDAKKEHSFEATPDSISTDEGLQKLEFLRKMGFSRISLGIQSFDDKVLKGMNRSHRTEHIPTALRNIRSLEFNRINFDIMLGVPNQPVSDFIESIQRSIDLGIEILELYTMRYFDTRKHVPATQRLQKGAEVPDPDEILAARIAADTMLRAAGYSSANGRTYQKGPEEYFSNYFLENFRGSNLLGIGRKSHSNLYPYQYANYLNIEKYTQSVDRGLLPMGAGCKFDRHARLGKLITGALQLPGALDLGALKRAVRAEDSDRFDPVMDNFVKLQLLEATGTGRYEKTLLGFLFVEEMMKVVFDACVKPFDSNTAFLGKAQVRGQPVVSPT